ncbi:MAG: hypothetical protein ABIR47_18455, partial [Candidatus Kapaibacterium sp.]
VAGRLRRFYPPLVVLVFVDTEENPKPNEWFGYFSAWYPGEASGIIITPDVPEKDRAEIMAAIASAGSVIAALFVKPRGYAGAVGLSEDQEAIVKQALEKQIVVLNFGNPYLLRDAEPNVRIDTFSASSASLAASIEALARTVK